MGNLLPYNYNIVYSMKMDEIALLFSLKAQHYIK